jgi:DNA-binding transcriptional ArsR family regulator
MSGEFGTVDFIFGERGEFNKADGFIGGTGEIGRHEVSDNLPATLAYGNLLIGSVFPDVRQLVWINGIPQKKCDQDQCLLAQSTISWCFDISAGAVVFKYFSVDNSCMFEKLSNTANLLGDPGRAAILLRLMSGLALPAGELAVTANVAPQTASEHLAKLVQGRLLNVERQGRHRYYRLANAEVANAIEALLVLTARSRVPAAGPASSRPQSGSMEYARTCYGHLAGWLGVQIAKKLEERQMIEPYNAKAYSVSSSGRGWFEAFGVSIPSSAAAQKKLAVRCLDWTERRHHLAGTLGCAIYKRFRELGWLTPVGDTRVVRVTLEGRTQLWKLLGIALG